LSKKQRLKLVKLSQETWENLRAMGKMGDTFNDVVQRILAENKKMSEELMDLRNKFPDIFELR
jgi:hypothetical protein